MNNVYIVLGIWFTIEFVTYLYGARKLGYWWPVDTLRNLFSRNR